MEIIDLADEYLPTYCACLEDWSDEMKEAGDHKERWYNQMRGRGIRVKLARMDDGVIAGMIQYGPGTESFIHGPGLYFIHCIWVHGYKNGIGNYQKHGIGKALLAAAEKDARSLGAKGMAAWGLVLPMWMKASWYKKHGYRNADRNGLARLVWKPFTGEALPPSWVREKKKPETLPGQVTVSAFKSGWCSGMNIVYERARRISEEFGSRVVFRSFDTTDRGTFLEWGISDAVFVDSRQIRSGPPASSDTIRKMITKSLQKNS